MTEMTKKYLRTLCKDNGLYTTPALNDKLYLHYKGFQRVENLEEYTGLKALWLEGNGLATIEGLENQVLLKSLYLHENIFETIAGLDSQVNLDTLNLSKNYIKKIENLAHMTKLTSLNLAHNHLSSADTLEHVLLLPSLQTIDLQSNKIDEPLVVDILAQMPDLRVVYLMGNPVVKKIPHYRKYIIGRCKQLKYLDDRPVFDDERRRVDAWFAAFEARGIDAAQEAEREELANIRREKDEYDERNFRAFEQMMREGARVRREKELAEGTGADAAPLINPFSGEAIIHIPESAELKRAREKRWGLDGGVEETKTSFEVPIATIETPAIPVSDAVSSDDKKSTNIQIMEEDDDEAEEDDDINDEEEESAVDLASREDDLCATLDDVTKQFAETRGVDISASPSVVPAATSAAKPRVRFSTLLAEAQHEVATETVKIAVKHQQQPQSAALPPSSTTSTITSTNLLDLD